MHPGPIDGARLLPTPDFVHPEAAVADPGFRRLQRALELTTGLDLGAYKERQMMRRITGFMSREGLRDLEQLADAVSRDAAVRQRLLDFLAINVTEFFRNPERYEELARIVLPELLQRFGRLRIWSAGCSNGAEPYSLAILVDELDPGSADRHQILGTDIDREALAEARKAVYTEDRLKEVSPVRRQRYFRPLPDGWWELVPEVRRYVRFTVHNLLRDPYPPGQHLILCRNVIIYFTETAKQEIFAKLAASLVPGGYLLVGSTETIFQPARYGLRAAAPFLYVRMEAG